MEQVDIVMFSMSHYTDWQAGRVNRNFHILQELQKQDRVRQIVSVDFLPFTWRKAAKIYWENVLRPMSNLDIIYGDLTSACHRVNSKLSIYSTIDSIYSQKTVVHELQRISRVLGLQNVVFWSYNPLFTAVLEAIVRDAVQPRAFVFDAVDNWIEHPAFKRFQTDLRVGYQLIRQDADLIFTVSDHIRKTLFADNQRSYTVMNGIDTAHFAQALASVDDLPPELASLPRPIIGYHGVVEDRVDLPLVRALAEKNPDKSFVLLGTGIWRSASKRIHQILGGAPNIHLIPFVPYQEVPRYIAAFDVALVPHLVNEFTRSMNPMKFYEYCAAGKPIVTRPVSGTETFGNLLYLADSLAEFDGSIRRALTEDSPGLRQARQEAVADDSWFGRVELMLKRLQDVLDAPPRHRGRA